MSCPTCSRCGSLVIQAETVLFAEHGELRRRWKAAGRSSRIVLCADCADDLVAWLRAREADDVLSPMPSTAFA